MRTSATAIATVTTRTTAAITAGTGRDCSGRTGRLPRVRDPPRTVTPLWSPPGRQVNPRDRAGLARRTSGRWGEEALQRVDVAAHRAGVGAREQVVVGADPGD